MSQFFNEEVFNFISKAYFWYVWVPVILGFLWRKKLTKVQVLIYNIALLSAINHLVSWIVKETKITGGINTYVYHAYVPILFYFTWKAYKEELSSLFSKNFFSVLLGLVLVFCVMNTILFQGLFTTPTNAIFVLSIVLIFWSISYFYSLLRQRNLKPLEKEPLFWLTTGQLVYYSSTILIFLLVYNYLEEDSETTYIALTLNAAFNLVLVTTYLIALWVRPEK